jgi:pimeloyl-ACP methyl ester carboxylesterase
MAEDVVTPLHFAQELAAGIPGARLQALDRFGHETFWQDPKIGIEALLGFLVPGAGDGAPVQQAP